MTWTNLSTNTLSSSGAAGTLPFINVKDSPYNARLDGVTDDSAAIQAALNVSGPHLVYVPAGTCRIASTLTISQSGVSLIGAGASVTTFTCSGVAADAMRVSGSGLFGIEFRDFTLNATGQTGSDSHGIRVNSSSGNTASRILFNGLRIFNTANDGIRLGPSGGAAGTASFVTITNCQIEFAGQVGPSGQGIGGTDCSDLVIANNILNNNAAQGIDLEPGASGNSGVRYAITGNNLYSNGGGINLYYNFGAPPLDAQGLSVIGSNTITSSSGFGIELRGQRGVSVVGNTISGATIGVWCVGGTEGVSISGGHIAHCSTSAVRADGSTTSDISVGGNVNLADNGIAIDAVNGATKVNIGPVNFLRNTTDMSLPNTSLSVGAVLSPTGTYSSDVGTWTSQTVTTFAYVIKPNKMMRVIWWIGPSTTTGAPGALRIQIPASKVAAKQIGSTTCRTSQDGSTFETGFVFVVAGGTVINIQRNPSGQAYTNTATIATHGEFEFEVQ